MFAKSARADERLLATLKQENANHVTRADKRVHKAEEAYKHKTAAREAHISSEAEAAAAAIGAAANPKDELLAAKAAAGAAAAKKAKAADEAAARLAGAACGWAGVPLARHCLRVTRPLAGGPARADIAAERSGHDCLHRAACSVRSCATLSKTNSLP